MPSRSTRAPACWQTQAIDVVPQGETSTLRPAAPRVS